MDHSVDIQKTVRTYLIVFASLMVLTFVTVAIAYLHLPIGQAVVIALIVATIKGSLVASYFMHLISEKKAIYAMLLLTGFMFAVLMFLINTGYNTRLGA